MTPNAKQTETVNAISQFSLAQPSSQIRLSEVLASLSYALDLTEGQVPGHAARTCQIGMRIADVLGLDTAARSDLFYALLLKDLGCSSNAAKMALLFGADDRCVKRDWKSIDWSKTGDNFRFAMKHVAPEGSTVERAMKLVAMALFGPGSGQKMIETRCERGADIARKLGFTEATAAAIRELDEHWDGHGQPRGLAGEAICRLARITGLAQTAEVFFTLYGPAAALEMARERRGTWFDPVVVDAFTSLKLDESFWQRLYSRTPHLEAAALEPAELLITADEARLDQVSLAFAEVVDAKSPWTFRHSTGVARIAVGVAQSLGKSPDERRDIRRMGLLHDIGKLGVSNLILDKPARLTDDELVALRLHPQYSAEILSRVSSLGRLAELAAAHHERLDGQGYHRGILAGELPIEARILTVADIFEALTAKRPYRDELSPERALSIMRKDVGRAICPECFAGLEHWLNRAELTSRTEAQLERLATLANEL